MPLSDFYSSMIGWTAVPTQPNPDAPTQIPDQVTTINPRLRTTVPLPYQYSPDTLRQYTRPGVSSFRTLPLAPSAQPANNAAIQSTSKEVITTAAAPTDIESVAVNKQIGTAYTVQASDNDTLITFNNNSGGTITLPSPNGVNTPGSTRIALDNVATFTGNLTSAFSSSLTSSGMGDLAMMFYASDNDGSGATTLTPTDPPWHADDTDPLNWIGHDDTSPTTPFTVSYSQVLGTSSCTWSCVMASFKALGGKPTFSQQGTGMSGSLLFGPQTSVFTKPCPKGSLLIWWMLINAGPDAGASVTINGDTLGNVYRPVGSTGTSATISTIPRPSQVLVYAAVNNGSGPPGGLNTISYTIPTTPSHYGGLTGCFEFVNVGATGPVATMPPGMYFWLQNTGTGTFKVTSLSLIDGASNDVSLGPGQGMLVVYGQDGNWYTDRGIGGAGSLFYQTMEQAGTAKTQRPNLNFLSPITVTDNAGNTSSDVAVPVATTSAAGLVPTLPNTASTYFDGTGHFTIPGSSGTAPDGLIHGTTPWPSDPGYVVLRDDFTSHWTTSPYTAGFQVGELGWTYIPASTFSGPLVTLLNGGNPPYLGCLTWENNGTANQYLALLFNNIAIQSGYLNKNSFPLLETPGWKASYIFKFEPGSGGGSAPNFTTTQKSLYIGFSGASTLALTNTNLAGSVSPRPDVFVGLRFDTSPTPGSLSIGSVNSASGGTSVYNSGASFPADGANNGFAGMTFVVSGFTNAVNNGTFLCSASTTTTLTLNNASAVAETHVATAAGPSLNDSFYTLEAVFNKTFSSAQRHNLAGQTLVTNVAPAAGVWHRLDIICASAGVVTLTLDGSNTNTATFTVSQMSFAPPLQTMQISSNIAMVPWGGVSTTNAILPFVNGSSITISGMGAPMTALNGTFTLYDNDATFNTAYFNITAANAGPSNQTPTIVGYPALTPCIVFGNDDTGTPTGNQLKFYLDYFEFIWNPALGAGGTPTVTKARYW